MLLTRDRVHFSFCVTAVQSAVHDASAAGKANAKLGLLLLCHERESREVFVQ